MRQNLEMKVFCWKKKKNRLEVRLVSPSFVTFRVLNSQPNFNLREEFHSISFSVFFFSYHFAKMFFFLFQVLSEVKWAENVNHINTVTRLFHEHVYDTVTHQHSFNIKEERKSRKRRTHCDVANGALEMGREVEWPALKKDIQRRYF